MTKTVSRRSALAAGAGVILLSPAVTAADEPDKAKKAAKKEMHREVQGTMQTFHAFPTNQPEDQFKSTGALLRVRSA